MHFSIDCPCWNQDIRPTGTATVHSEAGKLDLYVVSKYSGVRGSRLTSRNYTGGIARAGIELAARTLLVAAVVWAVASRDYAQGVNIVMYVLILNRSYRTSVRGD
jgi:hypothetical protein